MAENATIAFQTEAAELDTASQKVYSPITGIITRVTIAWPSGCNFLVEVLFRIGAIQVIPTPATGAEEGIRFNAWTEQIQPNYPVTARDVIEMYIINHDSVNHHKIAALMQIEQLEPGAEPIIRKPSVCVVQGASDLGRV